MASSSYASALVVLGPGDQLTSQNGLFTLNMQADGNLCVYYWQNADQTSLANRILVWTANTENGGNPALSLVRASTGLMVAKPNTNPLTKQGMPWAPAGWAVYPEQPGQCVSMDNDGCVRMYPTSPPPAWSTGNPPSASTATWQSPNGVLAGLMKGPAVAAYPPFQEPQYSNHGNPTASGAPTNFQQLFINAWADDPSVSSTALPNPNPAPKPDFIRSLYGNPTTYLPSNIQQAAKGDFPTEPPSGCSPDDWAVIQQIQNPELLT